MPLSEYSVHCFGEHITASTKIYVDISESFMVRIYQHTLSLYLYLSVFCLHSVFCSSFYRLHVVQYLNGLYHTAAIPPKNCSFVGVRLLSHRPYSSHKGMNSNKLTNDAAKKEKNKRRMDGRRSRYKIIKRE